jgi:hypothetical protein
MKTSRHDPARQAMCLYFEGKDVKVRQGNCCSIVSVLSDDYKKAFNMGIETKSDHEAVAPVAQDGIQRKSIVGNLLRQCMPWYQYYQRMAAIALSLVHVQAATSVLCLLIAVVVLPVDTVAQDGIQRKSIVAKVTWSTSYRRFL